MNWLKYIFKVKDNPALGLIIMAIGGIIFFASGTITGASGWNTGNQIGAIITVL